MPAPPDTAPGDSVPEFVRSYGIGAALTSAPPDATTMSPVPPAPESVALPAASSRKLAPDGAPAGVAPVITFAAGPIWIVPFTATAPPAIVRRDPAPATCMSPTP